MIRNLKALGLALVAVFAMSAMAASGASAQQGEATVESAPATVVGTEIPGEANELISFGQKVSCPGSTYDIGEIDKTPHEITKTTGLTTLTVTPTYATECRTDSGLKATVDTRSCDFVFHIGSTTEKEGTYGVTADVECEDANDYIDVTVFLSATNENITACTLKVTEQTGLTGKDVHLTNVAGTPDTVELHGTFENIHVEESGLCGTNTETGGKFIANVAIEAEDAEGPTGITISDTK